MESQQVDTKLLALLKELPYFSRLGTCLSIRLSDYAAQLCGCRSSRQISDGCFDDVDDQFSNLMSELQSQINECINYIKEPHVYKLSIIQMNEDDLENLLEDTLFEMVYFESRFVFEDYFLVKT